MSAGTPSFLRVRRELAVAEPVQAAAVGADPEASVAVLHDLPDVIVREPVLRGVSRDPAVLEAIRASAAGADPDALPRDPRRSTARGCSRGPRRRVRREHARSRSGGARPRCRPRESPARSSKSACALLLRIPGRVALVEHRELHAVEADQAALGAEPDVAVAGLENRLDRVLGQAVVGLPDLVGVLGDRLGRIEAGGPGPGAGARQHETIASAGTSAEASARLPNPRT